jgi:hypothetical protein
MWSVDHLPLPISGFLVLWQERFWQHGSDSVEFSHERTLFERFSKTGESIHASMVPNWTDVVLIPRF